MKLSEAIRLGAMSLAEPSPKLATFRYDKDGNICAACAIGCAAWAVGVTRVGWSYCLGDFDQLLEHFPLITLRGVTAPADGFPRTYNLGQIVSNLFETEQWSRERIADWVETIEAQYEGSPSTEQTDQELARVGEHAASCAVVPQPATR